MTAQLKSEKVFSDRAKKPGLFFISVGGRDILNPAIPVQG